MAERRASLTTWYGIDTQKITYISVDRLEYKLFKKLLVLHIVLNLFNLKDTSRNEHLIARIQDELRTW